MRSSAEVTNQRIPTMLPLPRLRAITALLLALGFAASAALAAPLRLPPQKDQLFAFPGVIRTEDGGDFIVVDYDKQRDIHIRDEVPEKKVQWKYVDTGVNWQQRHIDYRGGGGRTLRTVAVGATDRPVSMIVVWNIACQADNHGDRNVNIVRAGGGEKRVS